MQIIVESIVPIDPAIKKFTRQLLLRLPPGVPGEEFIDKIRSILSAHKGNCAVDIELRPTLRGDVLATIRPDAEWFVAPSRELVAEMTDLLGDQRFVKCMPKPLVPPKRKWRPGVGNQQQTPAKKNGGAVSPAVSRFN